MKKMRTHYDNLKVSMDAPAEVIQAAYRSFAKKYHPDRNTDNPDSARIMQLVNTAYEVLSDPVKRAEHGTWIRQENWKRKQESLKAERAERESTTSQAEKTAAHFRSKTDSFNAGRAGAGRDYQSHFTDNLTGALRRHCRRNYYIRIPVYA
uniref:J domain-containing protein n=1 Tax=Pluralibacter gergoviae TaxID=61647 RepID=UPI0009BF24C1|nr:DnaJ domain-containing protein [Pluralibacter gergoviae]